MDKISEQVLSLRYTCYAAHCSVCGSNFSVFVERDDCLYPYIYPNYCSVCGSEFHWDFRESQELSCEEANKSLNKEEGNNAS